MSKKYKVLLPNHDFFYVTKCKLTSTAIGLRKIHDASLANTKVVKEAGPSFTQVKLLKHTPSTAAAQIEILDEMLKTKLEDGSAERILTVTRDGLDRP